MSTTAAPYLSTSPPRAVSPRIESIDQLRGLIMIIMVLDHVRDFFHADAYLFNPTDLSKTSVFLFFTRWITHFCAPLFMFLSGVSARLYNKKKGDSATSFFLLTRGAWLIFLELTVVSIGWTFNVHFTIYILQVIWAFGVSMIALAVLVRARPSYLLLLAIALLAGHNLLDHIHVNGDGPAAFGWAFLHEQRPFFHKAFMCFVGYPILPWIGLMVLGYYIGTWYTNLSKDIRIKRVRLLGWAMIGGFISVRLINVYGDPHPWTVQSNTTLTLLSFFNVTKYPPSLQYVLMTVGPGLIFLSYTEKKIEGAGDYLLVFGRTAMFFYLIHIYLLHTLAVIASAVTGHGAANMTALTTWVTDNPQLKGYGFSLGIVYGLWMLIIIVLYPLCKWYDKYKRANLTERPWLSYL